MLGAFVGFSVSHDFLCRLVVLQLSVVLGASKSASLMYAVDLLLRSRVWTTLVPGILAHAQDFPVKSISVPF